MAISLYINDVLRDDLCVRRIRASYVAPCEAELSYAGRHDAALDVQLYDSVVISEGATVRFRGRITEVRPGGVAEEGVSFLAHDARWRLENEPVRINGRGFYVWNQRGSTCNEGLGGYDSPGADGGKWTCGEIVLDILEHALGLPAGGSDIAGHHGDGCCVTATYLTADDVAGYTASDILALDSVCGEFSVDNTPVAQAISLLLGLNGGFYGWRIDPASGELVVVDLDALPATDLEAGQLGQWQDAAGTDYRLLDNRLEWSLDGVCSTIVIQGTDRTSEEQPDNIEGSANAGKGCLGELERVAAPWLGWPAAYRALCQPARIPTGRQIDMDNDFTPPAGYTGYTHDPRVYVGSAAGAKYVYRPSSGVTPVFNLVSGLILFNEDPRGVMGWEDELWGWYCASMPFTVSAGPDGDAYDCYGYECARTVYDPNFRSVDGWPQPAPTDDDETAMGVLAERLLRLYKDVRRQGDAAARPGGLHGGPAGALRRGEPDRPGRRAALRQRADGLGRAAHQRRGGDLGPGRGDHRGPGRQHLLHAGRILGAEAAAGAEPLRPPRAEPLPEHLRLPGAGAVPAGPDELGAVHHDRAADHHAAADNDVHHHPAARAPDDDDHHHDRSNQHDDLPAGRQPDHHHAGPGQHHHNQHDVRPDNDDRAGNDLHHVDDVHHLHHVDDARPHHHAAALRRRIQRHHGRQHHYGAAVRQRRDGRLPPRHRGHMRGRRALDQGHGPGGLRRLRQRAHLRPGPGRRLSGRQLRQHDEDAGGLDALALLLHADGQHGTRQLRPHLRADRHRRERLPGRGLHAERQHAQPGRAHRLQHAPHLERVPRDHRHLREPVNHALIQRRTVCQACAERTVDAGRMAREGRRHRQICLAADSVIDSAFIAGPVSNCPRGRWAAGAVPAPAPAADACVYAEPECRGLPQPPEGPLPDGRRAWSCLPLNCLDCR